MGKIYTTREIKRMKNRIKNLQWDGKDHIGELTKYIKAKNADFGKEIEKALVRGLKIFLEEGKKFGKTTVLISEKQGIGRTVFCEWITSLLPIEVTENLKLELKNHTYNIESYLLGYVTIIANGQKNFVMDMKNKLNPLHTCIEIESIDFDYIKNVNITDIYAQAYHSYNTYLSRTIDFES